MKKAKVSFIEKHLFDPTIEHFNGVLERYREYEVELFLHVVSDPSCRYERGVGSNRTLKNIANLSAKERFLNLLKIKIINANPKGFYANKIKEGKNFPDEVKSVSFAYCKQFEASKHFDARNSEYGIVFYHDFLQKNGMIPVRYINEEDDISIRRLVFNEAFALEAYGKSYDMRWENEWRINHDVKFDADDVAFVVVPNDEYHNFVKLTLNSGLEYLIVPSSVFTNPLKFFLMADGMEHHSWSQIRLYDEWKVDFEMFPQFSAEEEAKFLASCGEHLLCLAKAEVQDIYERRYISRFIRFASSLNENFLERTSFKELKLVSANANEPHQTHRDIMMHCYTQRFEIQRDRITP